MWQTSESFITFVELTDAENSMPLHINIQHIQAIRVLTEREKPDCYGAECCIDVRDGCYYIIENVDTIFKRMKSHEG